MSEVSEIGVGGAGLWSCGKRGPYPVSHSPHRLYDDEPLSGVSFDLMVVALGHATTRH